MASNIRAIKKVLDQYLGKTIKVTAELGRNRVRESNGVLCETYPSVFIIDLGNESSIDRISYSYTDILTKEIVLSYEDEELSF